MGSQIKIFFVKAEWDQESASWYVVESDVPGLATGARTVEELSRKLEVLIPELLGLNAHLLDEEAHGKVPFELIAHRGMAVCTA